MRNQMNMNLGRLYRIVERPDSILGFSVVHHSGLPVVNVHHPVMAKMVLDMMNEYGEIVDADGRKLIDATELQRQVNRLFSNVSCPNCGALKGHLCKRPSGHTTHHGKPHVERAEVFDAWLDERRGAQ